MNARLQEVVDLRAQGFTQAQVADRLGLTRSGVQHRERAARTEGVTPRFRGQVRAMSKETYELPAKGEVKRYLLTCAQNNTPVYDRVWDNLKALEVYWNAEILVSTFTYDHNAYGELAVKRGTVKRQNTLTYDERVEPHVVDSRTVLAPGLEWCGEMNILPTAVRPLSGLHSYTGRASSIIPHVKIAMESVPSGKTEATKFVYTTGTVTKRNYIQKKEGLKAEFHHCYGALLVEVDHEGNWWCRQLNADSEGTIYDLDLRVHNGKITRGHRVKAINWGDLHEAQLAHTVVWTGWAEGNDGNMLDTLKPEYQFVHDVLDFKARNGHTFKRKHWFDLYRAFVDGMDSVQDECVDVCIRLQTMRRSDCTVAVVDSNHNRFLDEWLQIGDYKRDPVNARFFLEASLHVYETIERDPKTPVNLMQWLWDNYKPLYISTKKRLGEVQFLNEDESLVICPDANGGIECGMHGHNGPNGARGNPANLAKMGRKVNIGHIHSAGIHDGVYVAGVSGNLDMGYNKGPSSWSHSHIITYPNGKRAIVTIWNNQWRARDGDL